MFSWLVVLSLSALGLFDLFILIIASTGFGILIISLTQIAGASFGFWKVRQMDFNLFFFLDAELKKGEPVIRELWEEALILTGACLLIVPGFLSDLIGLAFLVPQLRSICLDLIYGY